MAIKDAAFRPIVQGLIAKMTQIDGEYEQIKKVV